MMRVGITGGIGSGKTEVRNTLQRGGYTVLSADDIAKSIASSNPSVRKRIVRLLGPVAFRADGTLNRPAIASLVFGNRRKERALNAIIHPEVLNEVRRRFRGLERKGHRVAFVEAALIFEAGMDQDLDVVVVVDAPREARIRRVLKRDGGSRRAVEKRMAAQWPSHRRNRKADIVLRNTGSIRELRSKVKFLARLFKHIAG